MKKTVILFLCLIILSVLNFGIVFADDTDNYQDISSEIENSWKYPIRLVLNGNEIKFDETEISPVIIRDRTLVPARKVFETLGGIVEWNEKTREVKVKLDELIIILTIDSEIALVNEQEKFLDVPAMVIALQGEFYGSTMIPVRFVAEKLGFNVFWNGNERIVSIKKSCSEKYYHCYECCQVYACEKCARYHHVNDYIQYELSASRISLPEGFAPIPMMSYNAAQKLIFIDVGHGGRDPGAIGGRGTPHELFEKTVNLNVGLYLRDLLEEVGALVYMSRDTDVFIPPAYRAYRSNELGSTLFVSIHNNASSSSATRGTEVLFYDRIDTYGRTQGEYFRFYSSQIAERVQEEMIKALGTYNRGVRQTPRMIVLNRTNAPAIIIEGAFLSNPEDFALIRSEEYALRYAYAVAKAIVEFFNEIF